MAEQATVRTRGRGPGHGFGRGQVFFCLRGIAPWFRWCGDPAPQAVPEVRGWFSSSVFVQIRPWLLTDGACGATPLTSPSTARSTALSPCWRSSASAAGSAPCISSGAEPSRWPRAELDPRIRGRGNVIQYISALGSALSSGLLVRPRALGGHVDLVTRGGSASASHRDVRVEFVAPSPIPVDRCSGGGTKQTWPIGVRARKMRGCRGM